MEPDASTAGPSDDYPGAVKALAIVAAVLFSLVTLIVALVLVHAERLPARRSFLKLLAVVSAVMLVVPFVVVLTVVSQSGGSPDRSGPCVGGPTIGAAGVLDKNGDAVIPCAISGTTKVHFP